MIEFTFDPKPPFLALAEATEDLSDVFAKYAQYRERRIVQQFYASEDPYGGQWARLTDAYIKAKRRAGLSDKPEIATGEMLRSFDTDPGKESYEEGFTDPKSKYQKNVLLPDDRGLPRPEQNELSNLLIQHYEDAWANA